MLFINECSVSGFLTIWQADSFALSEIIATFVSNRNTEILSSEAVQSEFLHFFSPAAQGNRILLVWNEGNLMRRYSGRRKPRLNHKTRPRSFASGGVQDFRPTDPPHRELVFDFYFHPGPPAFLRVCPGGNTATVTF